MKKIKITNKKTLDLMKQANKIIKQKKPKFKDAKCYKLIPVLDIKKTLKAYKQMKEYCQCQEKIKV